MLNSSNSRRLAIEKRRLLHAQIARSRRRINGRASRLVQGGFLPSGWRRQIQEHPAMALATAAGIGMLLAQLCARRGVAGKTGDWLAQWLAGGTWTSLMKQIEQFVSSVTTSRETSAAESADV